MRLLVLIAISFSTISLRSQQYYKIPVDSNYFWRQYSTCNMAEAHHYQLKYSKDTLLLGQTYNVYETFGRSTGLPLCESFISRGFLRQDTNAKTVTVLDSAFNERPLFNFSKDLGDTMLSYDKVLKANVTLTVMYVDTAYLNDTTRRKAMWMSDNNCHIEGVGSIFGGLWGDKQPKEANYITEQLVCFGTIKPFRTLLPGLTIYDIPCKFVPDNVGIGENQIEPQRIKIVPNPASQQAEIICKSCAGFQLSVYDALGHVFKTATVRGHMHTIEVSALSNGLYFVEIRGTNVYSVEKLLVAH